MTNKTILFVSIFPRCTEFADDSPSFPCSEKSPTIAGLWQQNLQQWKSHVYATKSSLQHRLSPDYSKGWMDGWTDSDRFTYMTCKWSNPDHRHNSMYNQQNYHKMNSSRNTHQHLGLYWQLHFWFSPIWTLHYLHSVPDMNSKRALHVTVNLQAWHENYSNLCANYDQSAV